MTERQTQEAARSAPPSNITEADVFAALFAQQHGREATGADRQIGERMRAQAHRMGWALVREEAGHG